MLLSITKISNKRYRSPELHIYTRKGPVVRRRRQNKQKHARKSQKLIRPKAKKNHFRSGLTEHERLIYKIVL